MSEAAAATPDVEAFLIASRERVERELDRLLPGEQQEPARLHQAMRYAVFAGGKRLRPALALACGRAAGATADLLAGAAAALELIHTYSLVHDDLPAMDDDDLRRGKPTCHVAYGEATAILAGDALLTLAFEVLASEPHGESFLARRAEAMRRVARAAGSRGMVGGQEEDIAAERDGGGDLARLRSIHRGKTGALLGASAALGAVLAGLGQAEVERIERFGQLLGLAFQIADDLLDVEGTEAELGKRAGKDAGAHKLTYPGLLGVEASRREAERLIAEAEECVADLPERALLRGLARYVVARRH